MAQRIYPFDSAEVKEDKADRATLTFYLSGLNSKQKVEASVTGRTLTVRAVVDGKTYESRPEFAGDVQQGRLEPKVKDGRVHVSFTKVNNFSLSTIPQ